MSLTKEQLKARLTEKTLLSEEQVGEQLTELVEEIRAATDRGGSYTIEGFGTFTAEDNELQFHAADILATEINNKYAGMKPIELIAAFKEPETGKMPDMSATSGKDGEVWTFDQAQASKQEQQDDPDESPAAPEEIPPEEDPVVHPREELPQEPPLPEPVEGAEESEWVSPAGKDPVAPEHEVTAESDEPSVRKKEKDPIGRFIAAAVALLVIGLGGWMGYEFLKGDNTKSPESALTEEPAQQMPSETVTDVQQEEQNEESADEEGNEEENSSGQENREPEALAQVINDEGDLSESAKNTTFGLEGTLDASVDTWYTIVVHSLRDEALAEDRKEQIEAAGYRAKINQVRVNGTLQFRVGMGQFATVEDALDAIEELSEPYKSNNFIKRFKI